MIAIILTPSQEIVALADGWTLASRMTALYAIPMLGKDITQCRRLM